AQAREHAVPLVPRHVGEPDPPFRVDAVELHVTELRGALLPAPLRERLLRAIPEVLAARDDPGDERPGQEDPPRADDHRRFRRSRISPSSRTSSGGAGGAAGAASSCRRKRLKPFTTKKSANDTMRKAM